MRYNTIMPSIYFASTNDHKIQIADYVCSQAKIDIKPVQLDINEIQGEDPELIVRDKVLRAFEQLGMPVVVTDDSWDIRALNGFPGAYMKSINQWFVAEDFIRLMSGIADRYVTLRQYLAYTDGNKTEIFNNDIHGQIINEVRGRNDKSPSATVTVLDYDNDKTIAEVMEQGTDALAARYKSMPDVWHIFAEWFKQEQ